MVSVTDPYGRILGFLDRRWKNIPVLNVRERVCKFMHWIRLAQNRDQWIIQGYDNEFRSKMKTI
jgi:hypothetical protein